MPILNVYRPNTNKDIIIATGKVISGTLRRGMHFSVGDYFSVLGPVIDLQRNYKRIEIAEAGDYVEFSVNRQFAEEINRGTVISDIHNILAPVKQFTARVQFFQ